jgi:hypothetical protein
MMRLGKNCQAIFETLYKITGPPNVLPVPTRWSAGTNDMFFPHFQRAHRLIATVDRAFGFRVPE